MRELPSKESGLFKHILKCYEYKQYKKGLKAAEQILRKFPEHGDTLAMKGLFLNHMDRKEEAYEFVKKGLSYDLKYSHICWHVYGLLHRSDKNYTQALKCYTQALKIDKANMQILGDYSLLVIQMRNYEAFNDSINQLLQQKPTNQKYWLGLAISYHLLGNYETAENVLKAHQDTLKEKPGPMDFEHSEMLLYHNLIIEESGNIFAALQHLDDIKHGVCDRISWKEKRAQFLLKLDRYEEAEATYLELIDCNPDCNHYFEGFLKSRKINPEGLNEEEQKLLMTKFKEFGEKYPRSNFIKRYPLQFTTGDNFRKVLDEYLQPMLRKGVFSLFVNIKNLYKDPEKEKLIESLLEGYLQSLKTNSTFTFNKTDSEVKEPPTAYLWTLNFLAQHYDHKGNTTRALELINEAIVHTPTMVELYMTKGRILKHGGDVAEAMKVMNEARELDFQDRFINTKCTKYMLRNGQLTEAEKIVGLFTRGDAPDPITDLVDMQCMWFALEEGECHMRHRRFGKALKRFYQIEKHFADITEDQFDFHSYCLRKVTLRAYLSMLRLEDQLRSHPYYFRAAQNAIKIYLNLYDNPSSITNGEEKEDYANMTEGEIKKAKSKAKKAAVKAQQEDAKKEEQAKRKIVDKPPDEDPDGEKFVKTLDPLVDALKFLRPLQELASKKIETHLMSFDIYLRKKKYLLALRSLLRAQQIEKNNPILHKNMIMFKITVDQDSKIHKIVAQVITKQCASILPEGVPLRDFNTAFMNRNIGFIPHLLLGAETLTLIDLKYKQEAEDMLLDIIDNQAYLATRTLPNCIDVYKSLVTTFQSPKAEMFRTKCKEWFPISPFFHSE
ncbi:hypothetical protein G9A89_015581 [Geosiphon pyriformis]|nr:hypothetical protein G9A89_015581 [Geosiphon pyriformis]